MFRNTLTVCQLAHLVLSRDCVSLHLPVKNEVVGRITTLHVFIELCI